MTRTNFQKVKEKVLGNQGSQLATEKPGKWKIEVPVGNCLMLAW